MTDLPSGKVSDTRQTEKTPTVLLTGSEVQFNDNTVTMEQLRERLAELKLGRKKEPEQRFVMMESAAGVPYQDYFEAMAAISQASGIVAIVKEGTTEDE